jgi:hypothetical protein
MASLSSHRLPDAAFVHDITAPECGEDRGVSVFKYDGTTYIAEPDGATVLKHAERSSVLADMAEAEGCTTLPLSHAAVRLWQEGVSAAQSSSDWGVAQIEDLCTMAQVSPSMASAVEQSGSVYITVTLKS